MKLSLEEVGALILEDGIAVFSSKGLFSLKYISIAFRRVVYVFRVECHRH